MIVEQQLRERYYKALVAKDPAFDGIFFAAIKTTGIFCHATCRARKPKFENCVFYKSAEEALLAGYRPCKICQPLSYPMQVSADVQKLIDAVEANPEKRWKEEDFQALGLHSATVRRQFKKHYKMTFVQYARARRMGLAFKEIQSGSRVIEQQLATGYQSASGFNDAFTQIMGNPAKKTALKLLTATFIFTPIGRMLAIADDKALYLLEFDNRRGLEREIERLRMRHNARILHGTNAILMQLSEELTAYFAAVSAEFTVPVYQDGTAFQQAVWKLLKAIPLGETRTYKDLALVLGDANKVRAVGNANGANQLAIIIPCHRVITTSGDLGGYGGGMDRKQYLLDLEKRMGINQRIGLAK